jgi:uncharacterized protein YkwD
MPSNDAPKKPPRRLSALIVAGILACASATAAVPAQAADCGGADAMPSEASTQQLADATLCLLNAERAQRGLAALRMNPRLSQAATEHSSDMVSHDYFSHTAPGDVTFVDRIRASGYLSGLRSWTIGENILWGTTTLGTPAAAMQGWMNSPGHRENILTPTFREVGIGIVPGRPGSDGNTAATYTTDFGAPTTARAKQRASRRARHATRRARRASVGRTRRVSMRHTRRSHRAR